MALPILAGFAAYSATRKIITVLGLVLLIAGLSWAIYAGIVRPVTKPNATQTTNQRCARDLTNNNYNPKVGIGCMRITIQQRDREDKPK